jgi:hypothetical protein
MSSKHADNPSENAPVTGAAPGATSDAADTAAQPHDAFFRIVFGDPAHAAAELKSILPPHVAAHIDWDSLTPVHASMVSKELEQRHGDLLFQARLVAGQEAFVWLMFEHQSTVERWMSWRLAGMIFHFLGHWLEQHPDAHRLPAVLPVVLYHGQRRWRAPTSLLDLTDLSDAARRDLAPLLLSLGFLLDDLSAVQDEEIDARPLPAVPRLTLGILKHYGSRDVITFMAQHAEDVRALDATEHGRMWLGRLLSYIRFANPGMDWDTIRRLLASLLGREIEPIMLTFDEMVAQHFAEEVLERAHNRGVEKGQREVLLRLLGRRFGEPPEAIVDRVGSASAVDVDRWIDRIFDAASLDDVFAAS